MVCLSLFETVVTDSFFVAQIFDSGDWDSMLLKYVVPKLGATLRDDFRVNPRNQNMEPLQHVLSWASIIRPSIFSQLLETEFFPKWLDVLHVWLIQPQVSFEEVAQWYSFWKSSFPDSVQNIPAVAHGFTRRGDRDRARCAHTPDAPRASSRAARTQHPADWHAETVPRGAHA